MVGGPMAGDFGPEIHVERLNPTPTKPTEPTVRVHSEFAKFISTMLMDIAEFHEKFGLSYFGPPRVLDKELSDFRRKFLLEELKEYADACDELEEDADGRRSLGPLTRHQVLELKAQQLDALVDLVYVALGTAYLHGFDFAEAWRRVHAANMAKVRVARPSDSKRGSGYDVVKPKGWVAPDLRDLVDPSRVL